MKTFGILMVALLVAVVALAAVPAQVSYQGQLTNAGAPASGELVFAFRIYDQNSAGSLLWSDTDTLTVTNGLFDAYLGSNTPLPNEIFTGATLWLEIDVAGETLEPRQQIVTVPYAFRSGLADTAIVALNAGGSGESLWETNGTEVYRPTGNVGIGTTEPEALLHVSGGMVTIDGNNAGLNISNSNGWSQAYVTRRTNDSDQATFVANPSGAYSPSNVYWAMGLSLANPDWHLQTWNGSSMADKVTVRVDGNVGIGTTEPSKKLHVADSVPTGNPALLITDDAGANVVHLGDNSFAPGDSYAILQMYENGVQDILLNTDANGVSFLNVGNLGIGTTSPAYTLDVNGTIHATNIIADSFDDGDWTIGSGVLWTNDKVGINQSSPSYPLHVQESSSTDNKRAVYGKETATSGNVFGVYGETASNARSSTDVTNPDGSGSSGSAAGVYGLASRTGPVGDVFGVLGEIRGEGGDGPTPDLAAGVYGVSYATTGKSAGVIGDSESSNPSGAGVFGINHSSTGATRGVWGEVHSHSGFGVYGRNVDAGVLYTAGYFEGNLEVLGTTKMADKLYVPDIALYTDTKDGLVQSYGITSASPMVSDQGFAELRNGTVRVTLDATFFELISETEEPHVQVTPYGPTGQLWVETHTDGFTIHDPSGSSEKVAYTVTAVRRGKEGVRLEQVDPQTSERLRELESAR